jgi:integrase/recombinase XerD
LYHKFLAWSENHVDDIRSITPMLVAAYMEKHPGSPQTIKQHLAAIKMLFDYLVISQREPDSPLFPAAIGKTGKLSRRPL